MKKRILVIDGHPDAHDQHFVHGLAGDYREAALAAMRRFGAKAT